MSFYATLCGSVKFQNKESFDALRDKLTSGGWVKDNQFIDEMGEPFSDEEHINEAELLISVPLATYRNLSRVDFFAAPDAVGYIKGSSTDGVSICWVDGAPRDLAVPEMPLSLFADDDLAPAGDEDSDEYEDQRIEWLENASDTFHSESLYVVMGAYAAHLKKD